MVAGVVLLALGLMIQVVRGDTAGWMASTDLTMPTAFDDNASRVPRNVLLSLDHEAALARSELGSDYVITPSPDGDKLSVTVTADSEDAAVRAIGRAVDLETREARIAQRVDAQLNWVAAELTSVDAERQVVTDRLGDDASIELGPIPLYVTEPLMESFDRKRADPNFSPLQLVTDVLRVENLDATRTALLEEQSQLAAGPSTGTVTASELIVTPQPRRGFGWRDLFKVLGVVSLLAGATLTVFSLLGAKARRRLAIGLSLVAVVWGILVVSTALQVRSHARGATSSLRQVEAMVSEPASSTADLAAIVRNMEAANTNIQQAHSNVRAVWMRPLYAMPGLHLLQRGSRATLTTAAQGVALATQMATHAQAAQQTLQADPTDRLGAIRQLRAQVARTSEQIRELELPPRSWLPGRLHNEYDELDESLDRARSGADDLDIALGVAEDLLGTDGQWLLIGGSSADPRMSMGAFLAAGTLTVASGDVRVSSLGDTSNDIIISDGDAATIDADVQRNFGVLSGNQRWPTLGYSPRFAPAAESAAQLWRQQTGDEVRGVIYLDSVAVADLAAVVAPVSLNGESYDGPGIRFELLRGQYENNQNGEAAADLGTQLAQTVMSKVLASADVLAIARALSSAAADRHVMMWSASADVQEPIARFGLDGDVEPASLGVSLASMSGKWGDWTNLSVNATSTCSSAEGLVLDLAITVAFEDIPDNLDTISRSQMWSEPLDNFVGLVAASLPASAATSTAGLGPFTIGEAPDGSSRLATAFVRLQPGEETTINVRSTLPTTERIPLITSGRSKPTAWSHDGTPVDVSQGLVPCVAVDDPPGE